MFAAVRSSIVASVSALAWFVAATGVATASWITIRNETKQPVVVQEMLDVNGQVKRGKPVNLLPGETLREFLSGPMVKKIDILDAGDPKRSLWSGSLQCKDESQTFSITGSGGTMTVRPVAGAPKRPRADRP